MKIKLKRIYEDPLDDDGARILVDRLWPRGVSKQRAMIEHWLKELSPSDDLRQWFDHDPSKWAEFKTRYFSELDQKREVVMGVLDDFRGRNVTFLFAAKEVELNNATALKEYFQRFEHD